MLAGVWQPAGNRTADSLIISCGHRRQLLLLVANRLHHDVNRAGHAHVLTDNGLTDDRHHWSREDINGGSRTGVYTFNYRLRHPWKRANINLDLVVHLYHCGVFGMR